MSKRKIGTTQNDEAPVKRRKNTLKQSKFAGVSWKLVASAGKWQTTRNSNGKNFYGGLFEKEHEAALAADSLVRKHNLWQLDLNFPKKGEREKMREAKKEALKNGYFGVAKNKQKWRATVNIGGEVYRDVIRLSKEECAKDADKLQRENGGDYCHLNFPTASERRKEKIEPVSEDASSGDEIEKSEFSSEESDPNFEGLKKKLVQVKNEKKASLRKHEASERERLTQKLEKQGVKSKQIEESLRRGDSSSWF